MVATSAPGTRLRSAAYGVLLGFVLLGALAAAITPRTRFQELSSLADEGWALPTLAELFPQAGVVAAPADEVRGERMNSGGGWSGGSHDGPGMGPIGTLVLLMWVVVGTLGYVETSRWAQTR